MAPRRGITPANPVDPGWAGPSDLGVALRSGTRSAVQTKINTMSTRSTRTTMIVRIVSVRFCFRIWSVFASTRESWSPEVIGPGVDPSMVRRRLPQGFSFSYSSAWLAVHVPSTESRREPSGEPSPVHGFQPGPAEYPSLFPRVISRNVWATFAGYSNGLAYPNGFPSA